MTKTTISSELTGTKTLPQSNFRTFEVSNEEDSGIDFEAAKSFIQQNSNNSFNSKQQAARPQLTDSELIQLEQQVAQAKRDKAQGKQRLSQGAKARIEQLIGASRSKKEVDIDGNSFILKTLKGKEQRESILAASRFDNSVESVFEIRKQLLARSLSEVAGTDIDLFLGESSLESKLDFIDELDEIVLSKLYNEYLIMVQDTQKKYFITNEAQAQEVLEDLKK